MTERDPTLVDAFKRAADVMPPAFVSYADVMERTGTFRARRVATWALTTAMFVIVAIAAVTSLRTAVPDTPTPPADGRVAAPPPSASDAGKAWVESIATGDLRRAWNLLAPATRSSYVDFESFKSEAKGWADGVGAWRDAPYTSWYSTQITTRSEGTIYAVTVAGGVSLDDEGTFTFLVWDAEGSDPKIDVLSGGDGSAFIDPQVPQGDPVSQDRPGIQVPTEVPAMPTFRAEVAASAARVTFVVADLDDPLSHLATVEQDGRFGYAEWKPHKRLPAGVHVLQMVVEHRDGGIAATSALFEVAN